jgi:hypothetical protein
MPFRLVVILACVSAILLAASVGGIYALALLIKGVATPTAVSPLSVRIALSCVFLALAIVLYVVKTSRYQFAYGFVEVAVGLVVNWQSLDSWFHPAPGGGAIHLIWARIAVLVGGTYLISRGVSNAIEGFLKFFPATMWEQITIPKFRRIFADGMTRAYYRPNEVVPTKHLRARISIMQDDIARLEEQLAVESKAGKDSGPITETLALLRPQLQALIARYEKEVTGREKVVEKPAS